MHLVGTGHNCNKSSLFLRRILVRVLSEPYTCIETSLHQQAAKGESLVKCPRWGESYLSPLLSSSFSSAFKLEPRT